MLCALKVGEHSALSHYFRSERENTHWVALISESLESESEGVFVSLKHSHVVALSVQMHSDDTTSRSKSDDSNFKFSH